MAIAAKGPEGEDIFDDKLVNRIVRQVSGPLVLPVACIIRIP